MAHPLWFLCGGWVVMWSVILCPLVSAQQQVIVFDQITIEDGLPDGQVLAIMQDSRGFIWFGTMRGVVRFNGRHFSTPALLRSMANPLRYAITHVLYETRDGMIWIGTSQGILVYDPNNESLELFNSNTDHGALPGNYITSIEEDIEGNIYVGTEKGLARFVPDTRSFSVATILRNNANTPDSASYIWRLYSLSNGSIYFVSDNTYWTIHPDTPYAVRAVFKNGPEPDSCAIYHVGHAHLLFATKKELILWNFRNSAVIWRQPLPDFLLGGQRSEIAQDSTGTLWFGTGSDGLYALREGQFIKYSTTSTNQTGLMGNRIESLYCDSRGNLWIGGMQGVNVLRANRLFPLYHPGMHATTNYIYRYYEDKLGGKWMSTYDGEVFHYRTDGTSDKTIFPQARAPFHAEFFPMADGTVWISTKYIGSSQCPGIYRLNPLDNTIVKLNLGDTLNRLHFTKQLEEDIEDHQFVWAATRFGLCRIDKTTLQRTWYTHGQG
ncbi:MAG TPA: two-component regulator propeller domain-containing protein, partial [Saprospiraceae bacterium]|nr:two-component regulator propeller domain-containing protein [Saprospiraceae bacterium]